ncbi:hypothetical protein JHK87_011988 [Glycine soja]|nr:hypothetical protein JHK87_011988 [Glycine soja]
MHQLYTFSKLKPSLSSNGTTSPSKTLQPSELTSFCEEASRKFSSLIAKSVLVAELTHVDDIVPVSIPSSGEKSWQLHSFPLASLADECEKFYELESSKTFDDYAGNYFVLATVFPSKGRCVLSPCRNTKGLSGA